MSLIPLTRERSLVALNPASRHGAGAERWRRVCQAVAERFDAEVVETDEQSHWSAQVGAALDSGVRNFIAAGGDGTVNALLNALAGAKRSVPLREVTLGAVGLGSSNDFHKPFAEIVQGIPVRLGAAAARDVGRARYLDDAGVERERLFLVSASIGITATANAFFNGGDWLLRCLKARWVGGAIAYAALRTIALCQGVHATLRTAGAELSTDFANLSVMKSPYLSGSFKYDTPVDPASGLFAINLCEDLGRLGLLRTLFHLARGRFLGRAGTRHAMLPELEIVPTRTIDLELDGEVVRARRVRFDLLPAGIRVCR
jgi:diacylglycerol kinase family enzyme